MMRGSMADFKDDIDWNVHNAQQNPVAPPQSSGNQSMADYQDQQSQGRSDVPLGVKSPQGEMVDTFLGKMPKNMPEFKPGTPENKKMMDEMINASIGGPGMKLLGEGAALAKPIISKGINYLRPSKAGEAAEEFRQTLGQGTSTENIGELGKRVQTAKGSAMEEALTPKRELYQQEGKTDVYKVNPNELPEGNLDKMAHVMDPGGQFGEAQSKALSQALGKYRKTGDIDSFLENSEDIFNIPELGAKQASKVEDALLLPTKRDSAYFTDDVTDFYGKRGLKTLHDAYADKPTLANYDALQSAIKKQARKLSAKGKSLDSAGEEKLDALQTNIKNLNSDKENFMQTLPDKMQNLENEFRQKYATQVAPYEEAGKTIRNLADPKKVSEVTPAQINRVFGRPNENTKKVLRDIGPSGARNILYNALIKVPEGDAEGMAKTVLDLKKTKGFDSIVSSDMEKWANDMLKRTSRANLARVSAKTGSGALAGLAIGGLPGSLIGAALPNIPKGMEYFSKLLKR